MSSDYTGTTNTGIVLSNPTTQNPATLAPGGYVTNTTTLDSGDVVYGSDAVAWTFTNYGTINATGTASSGVALQAGGDVTNAARALIAGVMNGVYIDAVSSAGAVTNFGTIAAVGTQGIGVNLGAAGYVANGSTGSTGALISGFGGVYTATAVNYGTIDATNNAVIGVDVTNSGLILSETGVGVAATSMVFNSGTIAGRTGIDIANITGVTNYVTNGQSGATNALVSGTSIGVVMADGFDRLLNFGAITGGDYGVFMNPVHSGSVTYGGGIANHGTIAGGIGIYDGSRFLVSDKITNFGTIAGAIGAGVLLNAYTDRLTNFGTIVGADGTAVIFGTGVDLVQVEPGAVFIGGLAGFNVRDTIDFADATVTNVVFSNGTLNAYHDGTLISALALPGISGSAQFTRSSDGHGGTDVGYDNGIRLTLSGTYTSTVILNNPPAQDAVVVIPGGVIDVASTGTASETDGIGILGTAGFAWTLTNYGTISGATAGVLFGYGGSVTNGATDATAALITGVRFSEVNFTAYDLNGRVVNYGTITNGVQLPGNVATVVNFGTIAYGVYGSGGLVTNFGTIAGNVYLRVGGTVTNFGAISGGPNGVSLSSGAVSLGNGSILVNSGTITAQTGAPGVSVGGNDVIINYGAIIAVSGTAVALNGYNNINLEGNPHIDNNLLVLEPNSTLVGSISGFDRGDAIDLAATVATSATYSSGTLTVQNGGTTVVSLLLADGGKYTGADFLVTPDGRGGTDITLQQVSNRLIDGTFTSPIFLSNPAYSNSTSIVATGRVSSDNANALFGAALTATLTNLGTVASTASSGVGVDLGQGGVVTNIAGSSGDGYISGSGVGVMIGGGTGTVTNSSTISGGTGVVAATGATATVTNSGRITGTSGTAVALAGGSNRLIVDPGAVFTGFLDGGNGSSVLEITSSSGLGSSASYGALGANGVAYVSLGSAVNFTSLQVDSSATLDGSGVLSFDTLINQGAINIASGDSLAFGTVVSAANPGAINLIGAGTVTLSGSVAGNQTLDFKSVGGIAMIADPAAFAATIAGFAPGDTIDLTNVAFDAGGSVTLGANNQLQITENATTYDLQLDPTQDFTGYFFHLAGAGGGTGVSEDTTPCFCRGTLILTEAGEVAVENLAIGDRVMTIAGAARPIKWIGQRAYDRRFVAGNRKVWPIRIEADALGDGVPARDLWVSPEHALYIRKLLVPAHLLVNGAAITQVESIDGIEYFHIELDTHDVILAEGAPAETFVDCDNRFMFHNSAEFAALYPDVTPPAWEFCAPRVEEGAPELAAIRKAVLARAELSGRFTGDPDLHLVVDDTIVRPQSIGRRTLYRFQVPAGSRSVSLASRTNVPAKVGISAADGRRLGVAVERIVLRDAGLSKEIGHACPTLSDGFHEPAGSHRWTDGSGHLPSGWLAAFAGDCILEVHLAETKMRYGLDAPARNRRAATRRIV